jgi:hypothetical protein
MASHRGVVLHIADGTYEGTIAWCRNSSAEVSAHFVTGKTGELAQLVDTDTRSWCQSAGNADWLSVENAGWGGEALTDAQVLSCAKILAKAHQVYGVPLQVAQGPLERGLGHHSMGGLAWGSHPGCPGERIIAQKPEILRIAAAIVRGERMDEAGGAADFAASNVSVIDATGNATGSVCGSHVALGAIWSGVNRLRGEVAALDAKVDGQTPVIDYRALALAILGQLGPQ